MLQQGDVLRFPREVFSQTNDLMLGDHLKISGEYLVTEYYDSFLEENEEFPFIYLGGCGVRFVGTNNKEVEEWVTYLEKKYIQNIGWVELQKYEHLINRSVSTPEINYNLTDQTITTSETNERYNAVTIKGGIDESGNRIEHTIKKGGIAEPEKCIILEYPDITDDLTCERVCDQKFQEIVNDENGIYMPRIVPFPKYDENNEEWKGMLKKKDEKYKIEKYNEVDSMAHFISLLDKQFKKWEDNENDKGKEKDNKKH